MRISDWSSDVCSSDLEKLHETLFHADERYRPTAHPKILQAEAREVVVDRINGVCVRLRDAVARYDTDELATLLRAAVPEFIPADSPQLPRKVGTAVAFQDRESRRTCRTKQGTTFSPSRAW